MSKGSAQAVVIGLGINALGTVRALARRGVRVVAISTGRGVPSEFTRYCEKIIHPPLMDDADAILEPLETLRSRLDGPAVVFPSSDLHLPTLAAHRSSLEPYYRFPLPDAGVLSTVLDKSRFYRFAIDNGLPVGRVEFVNDSVDLRTVARDISYPCLLKPSIATPAWRRQGLKILPIRNADELLSIYASVRAYHDEFVLQEIVPGPDSALHFSLTYLTADGTSLAMFTGRKIRQWVPRYGISSMALSEWNEEVSDLSSRVLSALRYQGYGSVEFKRDPRDGRLLMTEVTARTWYPHALSERCGINLPYLAYCDLLGLPLPAVPRTYRQGARWIDEASDFRSALSYWREGELSLADWARSYRGKKYWALFAWDDPRPGMALTSSVLRSGARYVFKRLGRLGRRGSKMAVGRLARE